MIVDKQSQDLFSPNSVDRSSTSLQNIDTLDFNDWVSFFINKKQDKSVLLLKTY